MGVVTPQLKEWLTSLLTAVQLLADESNPQQSKTMAVEIIAQLRTELDAEPTV